MIKSVLVLMSSYNGQKYIEEQIHSILKQKTDCKINLRIRDDGSQDRTCDIIEQMQLEYPGLITLVRGTNIGYNASFFELLKNADGYDYYAISDQDDVWLENKIQTAVDFLDKEDSRIPVLYSCTSYLVEDDLKPYGSTRKQVRPFVIYNTIIQNICPGHNQVLNQSLLDVINQGVDPKLIYVYDSWILNMAVLYGKVVFNNQPCTYYRQHRYNELGSGSNATSQLMNSVKHSKSGHGAKYRRQIAYFVEKNREKLLQEGYLKEIVRFIEARSFWQRIAYAFTSKLIRQTLLETVAIRCAIAIGRF